MQATSASYSEVICHIQGESRRCGTAEVDSMRARRERRKHDVEPIGDSWGNGRAGLTTVARNRHSKYLENHVIRRWWQRVAEYWRNGPIGLEVGKGMAIDAGVEVGWWEH
jgi:hypothetical protein